jgi:hypothetical protein
MKACRAKPPACPLLDLIEVWPTGFSMVFSGYFPKDFHLLGYVFWSLASESKLLLYLFCISWCF